ncbi:MAG TPA: group II intron reverse transcriptase/maturase [Thermoanaerobaculia bacterium]|jgi:RNA-directed DNA polymerase|nr:group II intron reverse transcriptase/maturase [Thermoanaerobaculia bacterium]
MSGAKTSTNLSPKLLKVAERAKREPETRLLALAHLMDEELLKEAFGRIKKDAAVGVDGVTKEQYGACLEENIRALHAKMREGRYRHQPIRRVHIPKAPGRTRPIGISTVEDKIVQNALATVLGAIYEQDFLDCSYGFRPRRSAHDALRSLNAACMRDEVSWVLEADIESFFDSIDRKKLMEMLRQRVNDESFLRLVGKCLHVGVLDGEEYSEPDVGTAQGSALSPMLGNIYLHHVLDVWLDREVRPRLRGKACLVRYADDLVIGFERREEAEMVMAMLQQRMAEHGLRLHPDKTRLVPFQRPPSGHEGGKGPGTFDFLGFTLLWRRTRKGDWAQNFKTRKARLQRAKLALSDFCRRHRHLSVKEQHASLCRRISGHFNYFGVNGNLASLVRLARAAERIWYGWLRRRSHRTRLNWQRFGAILRAFPLPRPRIRVQLWAKLP